MPTRSAFFISRFLCTLAARSGGRYHHYTDEVISQTLTTSPFYSEDLTLIRDEIERALEYLNRMTELREECHKKQRVREKQCTKRFYKKATPPCSSRSISYSKPHNASRNASQRATSARSGMENKTSAMRSNRPVSAGEF